MSTAYKMSCSSRATQWEMWEMGHLLESESLSDMMSFMEKNEAFRLIVRQEPPAMGLELGQTLQPNTITSALSFCLLCTNASQDGSWVSPQYHCDNFTKMLEV